MMAAIGPCYAASPYWRRRRCDVAASVMWRYIVGEPETAAVRVSVSGGAWFSALDVCIIQKRCFSLLVF